MLILQKKISQGDLESIDVFSEKILDRSRSSTERDHLIEARVRMERALLGMIDQNSVGTELRWCVDRLNALCPGSVNGPRIDKVIELDAEARDIPAGTVRELYLQQNSLGVFVEADHIAQTVHFLCSPAAQHISGQAIPIDGHTETLSS